jgi:hypothetical protein
MQCLLYCGLDVYSTYTVQCTAMRYLILYKYCSENAYQYNKVMLSYIEAFFNFTQHYYLTSFLKNGVQNTAYYI